MLYPINFILRQEAFNSNGRWLIEYFVDLIMVFYHPSSMSLHLCTIKNSILFLFIVEVDFMYVHHIQRSHKLAKNN